MNFFKKMNLTRRFMLLIGFFLFALALYGAWSFRTLEQLMVSGPLYQRIAQSKDLIADVAPPPVNILDSYQVSLNLAANLDPIEHEKLLARLKTLKNEYDTRLRFWSESDLDANMKSLLKESSVAALAFYAVAFDDLEPAAEKFDSVAISQALGKMREYYEKHSVAINKAVELANKRTQADEAQGKEQIQTAIWVMGAIWLFAAGTGVLATLMVSRSVLRRLGGEPDEAAMSVERIANGDLSTQVRTREGDQTSLLANMKHMREQLHVTVSAIKDAADAVGTASQEIAQGQNDMSSRTEEQASSLEEMAASMEQMTATVAQNAENAKKANQLAVGASDVAVRGGKAVREVVGTMSAITESSKKIADIIGVIDGIAFQTNILALNAAVEAARAGEQGRGFAVVASEVRGLAQRSAAAAKEIKDLIGVSVAHVDVGSRQVEAAGQTVDEIVASVMNVSALIAEIATASQEQAQGIAQVSETVSQMEQVTQQNVAMVEEMTAASGSLEDQALALKRAVGSFTLGGSDQARVMAASPAAIPAPRPADAKVRHGNQALASPKQARLPGKDGVQGQARPVKGPQHRAKPEHQGKDWAEF